MLIFRVGSLLILFHPLHSQVVYQLDRVNAPATATFILFGLFYWVGLLVSLSSQPRDGGDQSDKKAEEEEAVLDILFTIHGTSLGIL